MLRNVTKVQSFVGFINFYRHTGLLAVTKPLHHLTKKGEAVRVTL